MRKSRRSHARKGTRVRRDPQPLVLGMQVDSEPEHRGLPWRSSLRLHAANAEGTGSGPGQGTKVPHTMRHSLKIKKIF